MTEKIVKEIFWEQQLGNKYLIRIAPDMLTGEYKVLRKLKFPPFYPKQEKEDVLVTYDRRYVIQVVKHAVIEPLAGANFNEIQKILAEAYKVWKNEQEQISS